MDLIDKLKLLKLSNWKLKIIKPIKQTRLNLGETSTIFHLPNKKRLSNCLSVINLKPLRNNN